MATLQLKPWHRAGLALMTALCMQSAFAQDNSAAAPAPMAAPAPAAAPMADAAPAAAADAPKKHRRVARRLRLACVQLDDPWDNLCAIQKKAEIACGDLPNGKRKAKRSAAVVGNPRKECVDSYMRNV